MSNTYTSSFQFIQNGQSTTEDPAALVGNNAIVVNNPEIQWEGSTTTSSNTSYSTNTNTGSATATTESNTSTEFNRNQSSIVSAQEVPADSTTTETFQDEMNSTALDNDSPTQPQVRLSGLQGLRPNVESWTVTYEARLTDAVAGDTLTFTTIYVKYDTASSYVEWSGDLDDSEGDWLDIATVSGSGDLPKDEFEMELYAKDENENDILESGVRLTLDIEYYPEVVESRTASTTFPPVPDGYEFDYHEINKTLEDTEKIYTNRVGETVSQTSNSTDFYAAVTLETHGTKTNYYTSSDTTSVSYPSVPNGYSFSRHYYREEKNGSYVDSDYSYSNKVGQSRSVTSNNTSVTRSLEMKTRGEDTNTFTNYTNNPSVGGDVSASSSASLDDNETSSWQSLSGFGLGDNTFSHNIGDSGEGYYRIRFDWEVAYPTEIDTVGYYDGSTVGKGRLVDPNDEALEYNSFRTYTENGGILAFDIVDPSDEDVADFYINHPTHGVLGLRLKQT